MKKIIIDDFPIKTSIYKGFSMAMLNNQTVNPSPNHCFLYVARQIRSPTPSCRYCTMAKPQTTCLVLYCADDGVLGSCRIGMALKTSISGIQSDLTNKIGDSWWLMDGLNMIFHGGFQCFDESVHGFITKIWDLTFGFMVMMTAERIYKVGRGFMVDMSS